MCIVCSSISLWNQQRSWFPKVNWKCQECSFQSFGSMVLKSNPNDFNTTFFHSIYNTRVYTGLSILYTYINWNVYAFAQFLFFLQTCAHLTRRRFFLYMNAYPFKLCKVVWNYIKTCTLSKNSVLKSFGQPLCCAAITK